MSTIAYDVTDFASVQAAYDAAVAAGGANLLFPSEEITTDPLIIAQESGANSLVNMIGTRGSILKLANGSNDNLITVQGGFFSIHGLVLDGNRDNQTAASSCIKFEEAADFCSMSDMYCKEGYTYGINVQGADQLNLSRTRVFRNTDGINIKNGLLVNITDASTIEDNDNDGIIVDGEGSAAKVNIEKSYLENNGRHHIYIKEVQSNTQVSVERNQINTGGAESIFWDTLVAVVNHNVNHNSFENCSYGAFKWNVASAQNNDLRFNAYNGTTPTPLCPSGFIL